MKKINHWINGKTLPAQTIFIPPTRPPARYWLKSPPAAKPKSTAVAAAKEAFPKWANLPMKERARLMRRTGI